MPSRSAAAAFNSAAPAGSTASSPAELTLTSQADHSSPESVNRRSPVLPCIPPRGCGAGRSGAAFFAASRTAAKASRWRCIASAAFASRSACALRSACSAKSSSASASASAVSALRRAASFSSSASRAARSSSHSQPGMLWSNGMHHVPNSTSGSDDSRLNSPVSYRWRWVAAQSGQAARASSVAMSMRSCCNGCSNPVSSASEASCSRSRSALKYSQNCLH